MSRIETFRACARQTNRQSVISLTAEMDRLSALQRQVHTQAQELAQTRAAVPEDLAKALLPLAQAMARLTEESTATLYRWTKLTLQHQQQVTSEAGNIVETAAHVATDLNARLHWLSKEMDRLEVARTIQDRPTPSPWPAALLAAMLPTAAVLWLAHRVGVL